MRTLSIITGAAGVGKSTIGAAISDQVDGVLALDVDAFAAGSAAAEARDYLGFWRDLLIVTGELDVDVVWCGICRPEQILGQPADLLDAFSGVEMLVLTCEAGVQRGRLRDRLGGPRLDPARVEFHVALNADLRAARSGGRLEVTQLDTSSQSVAETLAACRDWLAPRSRSG